MRVLIYSANVGNYDVFPTHVTQTIPCDFETFTDPIEGLTNSKASRWYKTHPPAGYDVTIYVDGNIRIKSHAFAQWLVDNKNFGAFKHPNRNCLYDEAAFCRYMRKCLDQPVWEQAEHYKAEGMPEQYGLWTGGILVRTPDHDEINEAWWTEIKKWSARDQISLPYVFWKQGKKPHELPCSFPSNMVAIDSSAHAKGYDQCPPSS